MECKHGAQEPCDLCAQEDAEHDREMAIQALKAEVEQLRDYSAALNERCIADTAEIGRLKAERAAMRARLMELHERDK